jgi:hypothetical protein
MLRKNAKRVLRLDSGENIAVSFLAKGSCALVFTDSDNNVYHVTNDFAKEVLSYCSGYYLPVVEHVGNININSYGNKISAKVYKMPFYDKFVIKTHTEAAKLRRKLIKSWQKSCVYPYKYNYLEWDRFIDQMGKDKLPENLIDNMRDIQSHAFNYNTPVCFDFHTANAAIGHEGQLILLDPIYSYRTSRRSYNDI